MIEGRSRSIWTPVKLAEFPLSLNESLRPAEVGGGGVPLTRPPHLQVDNMLALIYGGEIERQKSSDRGVLRELLSPILHRGVQILSVSEAYSIFAGVLLSGSLPGASRCAVTVT